MLGFSVSSYVVASRIRNWHCFFPLKDWWTQELYHCLPLGLLAFSGVNAGRDGINFYYCEHYFIEKKQQKWKEIIVISGLFSSRTLILQIEAVEERNALAFWTILLRNLHFSILVITSLSWKHNEGMSLLTALSSDICLWVLSKFPLPFNTHYHARKEKSTLKSLLQVA